jgi:hypothetical protein
LSLHNLQSIVVGTLFDGRLQIWANVGVPNGPTQAYTKWKTTTDPNSEWTDWNHIPEDDGVSYLAAVIFTTGQSELFATMISGIDTVLVSKYKVSTDSNSDWGEWEPFLPTFPPPPPSQYSPQLQWFAAAVLGGPQQGPYWANTPIQLWISSSTDDAAWTVVSSPAPFADTIPWGVPQNSEQGIVGSPWQGWSSSPPTLETGGVWPLYSAGAAGPFNLDTFPLWVFNLDAADNNLYWIEANLTNGPNWGTWSVFQPLPLSGNEATLVSAMAASQLPDGRFQLFVSDSNGFLYSIWQDTSGEWLPSWQTDFPQPGSGQILIEGPTNLTLAMAPLPDGRLQLFAIDASGDVWSTWKLSTDPDSGWATWAPFG